MGGVVRQFSLFSVLAISAAATVPATAEANANPFDDIPVSGMTAQGQFTGKMTVHGFYQEAGQIWAAGIVTGTLNGNPIVTAARSPVTGGGSGSGSDGGVIQQLECDILFLQLGPIHLDLLGLVVDVNQITIEIDAERGPGNLLGNLLCALVGLFDGLGGGGGLLTQILNQIVALLNQLLGVLNQF